MAPTLTSYLTDVQNLLGTGSAGNLYSTANLTSYINEARNHVASDGQCIRVLPVISGPITSVTVTSGGTGYPSSVAVVFSAPDSASGFSPYPNGAQASATATVSGGSITAVTILSGGAGYFNPAVSFTSGTGKGAIALAMVSGVNQTIAGQEVYPFAMVNPLAATSGSGINRVLAVNGISVIWGTYRYSYDYLSFSAYQAKIRNYSAGGYQYIPAIFTQFAQGDAGTIFMYPVPNAGYQMEWDCYCLPNDLGTNSDPEPIPYPWTEAVKYYAAYRAFLQAQRFSDAEMMYNQDPQKPGLYQKSMQRARHVSGPRRVASWYGRRR